MKTKRSQREATHPSFVPVFETALDCLVMPSIMSCTSATPSDEDSLTSLPSPTSHWSLRKKFLVERSVSKDGLRREGDVCRDDETDTVTTRPLEEESESTLEISSHRLQFFYRYPRSVSFQLPSAETRGDRTCFKWSTLNHETIWWSKEELRRIYKETREEAQEKVADGSYKLVNAAFAAIHKQANDASYKDSSITPLLHGSAAQQVLESARHIRGLELFSPPIKAATASHLHGVLAVQRSLLRKSVDLETRGAILRKASLRRSRASKAIAYLLGRVNCQEVREMLQEELSEKMEEN